MKKNIKENIKGEVYSSDSPYRAKFDPSQCNRSVHEQGRGVGFHQCSRKPTERIEGYNFCSQHAKEIRLRYGISDVLGVGYVASIEYGEVRLAKFSYSEKTDKFYDVISVEPILGDTSFYNGRQKIDSDWNRRFGFFENEKDAWVWLKVKAKTICDSIENELKKARNNIILIENRISE